MVLGQWTELIKIKLNRIKGGRKAYTKFDVLKIINIIKYTIFKFEYQKHLPLSLHQSKINFYTLHQGNISNADYLEKFNNLVKMVSASKSQIHDTSIVDIMTEEKYPGGGYKIIDPDKK